MEAVPSKIQGQVLGNFTQLKEFEIQDALISSVSSEAVLMSDAPKTYSQALELDHQSDLLAACNTEVGMMLELDVWQEVQQDKVDKILNCCWVFALKRSQEGKIIWFKDCIVAQGFLQIHGVNVSKKFAPTPMFSSLRLLLAMLLRFGWPVASFDVGSTFLHSDIHHDIYICLPPGVAVSPGCAIKLCKELYGNRQASRCWWLHLKEKLATIGFHPNLEDQSAYTYHLREDKFMWTTACLPPALHPFWTS